MSPGRLTHRHPMALPFFAAIRDDRRNRNNPGTVSEDGVVLAAGSGGGGSAAFSLARVREDTGSSSLEIDMAVKLLMRSSVGSLDGVFREVVVPLVALAELPVLFGVGTLAAERGRAERRRSSRLLGRGSGSGFASHLWLAASVRDMRFLGSYSRRLHMKSCPRNRN